MWYTILLKLSISQCSLFIQKRRIIYYIVLVNLFDKNIEEVPCDRCFTQSTCYVPVNGEKRAAFVVLIL